MGRESGQKNKAAVGIKPYNAYEKFTEKTRESRLNISVARLRWHYMMPA